MPPVLFLVFNRPDVTKISFSSIRKARPAQLFVAADGPRPNRSGEKEACEMTRTIATNLDWDCELKTLFRDENLGCKRAVSEAITWFFQHVENGIILEDDCVADPTFFKFCDELLKKYSDDTRVGAITGNNFQRGRRRGNGSYYFSKYTHCWGWATWRRCWEHYKRDPFQEPDEVEQTINNFSNVKGEVNYWKQMFEKTQSRQINTWDFAWAYTNWKQRLLTVTPQKNLVENIGFTSEGTHTKNMGWSWAPIFGTHVPKANSIEFPLVHPETIMQNIKADAFVAKRTFHIDHFMPLRRALKFSHNLIMRQK